MEGCVAIYSDLGASFQCLVITSARANSACSDLRPISWKYIVRPRLLTDEAVNKMMCCCCGKPNLCFSFLRRFRSNEPIYLAKNRFQTNLDSKHLFAIVFIPPVFKVTDPRSWPNFKPNWAFHKQERTKNAFRKLPCYIPKLILLLMIRRDV